MSRLLYQKKGFAVAESGVNSSDLTEFPTSSAGSNDVKSGKITSSTLRFCFVMRKTGGNCTWCVVRYNPGFLTGTATHALSPFQTMSSNVTGLHCVIKRVANTIRTSQAIIRISTWVPQKLYSTLQRIPSPESMGLEVPECMMRCLISLSLQGIWGKAPTLCTPFIQKRKFHLE